MSIRRFDCSICSSGRRESAYVGLGGGALAALCVIYTLISRVLAGIAGERRSGETGSLEMERGGVWGGVAVREWAKLYTSSIHGSGRCVLCAILESARRGFAGDWAGHRQTLLFAVA